MCHNQVAAFMNLCWHAIDKVHKEENLYPRWLWRKKWREGKTVERMCATLHAALL